MSDRVTSIRPRTRGAAYRPGEPIGFQEWGRLTRAEMLAKWREHYQRELETAQAALAMSDDELVVETFLGPYAMRKIEVVTE